MGEPLGVFDPFLTALRHDPDFGHSDQVAEFHQGQLRDQLIEQLVSGQQSLEAVLDCLSDQGIDPDAWLDATIENIEYVIDQGIRFEPSAAGLLLPTRF